MDESNQVMSSLKMLPSLSEYGLTNSNLVQINCSRSIATTSDTSSVRTDNFNNGVMDFNFAMSQNQRFSCQKSYFRAEISVAVKEAGLYRQPKVTDNFCLAENFMNNIIANSFMYIGSKSISSQTQYHGVSAMLRSRLTKSYSWFQTLGKSCFYLDPSFESRQRNIVSNGDSEVLKWTELGYKDDNKFTVAGASLNKITFSKANSADNLPATGTTWRKGDQLTVVVGGITLNKVVSDVIGDDVFVTIPFASAISATDVSTLQLTRIRYLNSPDEIVDGRNKIQVLFQLPLSPFYNSQCIPTSQIRFSLFPQTTKNTAFEYLRPDGTGSPSQADTSLLIHNLYFFAYIFDGEKNYVDGTYYLNLSEFDIQSKALVQGVNSDTTRQFNIPSSTLGIASFSQDSNVSTPTTLNVCPSRFISRLREETDNLTGLQLQYSNAIKPVQLYQSEFNDGTQNIVQRYYETMNNSGITSGETFDDWLERGQLSYYSWIRPSDDRSTSLQVQAQYGEISNNTLLFIASVYRRLIAVQVINGEVSTVESLNV